MVKERRYPIGIQTFSEIIRGGYVYVDKTDLVWKLANDAKFIFLSRPRRFGKSLLTTTLEAYFEGEKNLFEGLKIMRLEREWEQYPVLHIDLSTAKEQPNAEELRSTLMWLLEPLADLYGRKPDETSPGKLLAGIINRAKEKTGKQVVVLIDEYDAPLLDVLHEDKELTGMRKVMQEFYVQLKANERNIRFCFITGITKFSQLSIFSTINNLLNVTMDARFSAICGITEQELSTQLMEDINHLASVNGLTAEQMHQKLKQRYDGYHFTEDSEGIYNPFSLLKSFHQQKLSNYWFESGTPTFLIRQMQHYKTDILSVEHLEVPIVAFDQPTENMEDALPLLYQTGYLTIKDYDHESEIYTLGIPNQEVRIGYTQGLLPAYTGLNSANVQAGFALKFWRALKKGDADLAMQEMQSYLAGILYVEGFKKKLNEAATAEGFYEYTLYLIFSMLNVYVHTQVKCAGGQTDMVIWMPDSIYVLELKVNSTALEALNQINSKGYAMPYNTDSRKIVKIGISFNSESRTIDSWLIEERTAASGLRPKV